VGLQASLNFSQCGEGRSWGTCARGGMVEARLCACAWLSHDDEIRRSSARCDARQSRRHGATRSSARGRHGRGPCAPPHEPFGPTVEGWDSVLGDVVGRPTAPRRPRHRFGERFGIPPRVVGRWHRRLHQRRRHQLHLMAVRAPVARPVMGTTAGFQTNAPRGERRDTGHHLRAIEPLTSQHRAVRIHPHGGKRLLCPGDADDVTLLPGTRLLWRKDCMRLASMLAPCSRSAQGAGPWHSAPRSNTVHALSATASGRTPAAGVSAGGEVCRYRDDGGGGLSVDRARQGRLSPAPKRNESSTKRRP